MPIVGLSSLDEQITIPVGQAVFDMYKGSLARPNDSSPRTHELSLNGMATTGRWVLIGLRADYVLGQRAYWLTFSWTGMI